MAYNDPLANADLCGLDLSHYFRAQTMCAEFGREGSEEGKIHILRRYLHGAMIDQATQFSTDYEFNRALQDFIGLHYNRIGITFELDVTPLTREGCYSQKLFTAKVDNQPAALAETDQLSVNAAKVARFSRKTIGTLLLFGVGALFALALGVVPRELFWWVLGLQLLTLSLLLALLR